MLTNAASATRKRTVVALIAGVSLSAAVGASPAHAAPAKKCPKHTTEVARDGISVLWTDKGKLWSCTTQGGRKPQNRVLGPWTKGKSQIILGGSVVGWTHRKNVAGTSGDYVMGAALGSYATSPVFLPAGRPAIGPGTANDYFVSALVASGRGLGWVTSGGRVMVAYAGAVRDAEAFGLGTPGAKDAQPGGVTGEAAGLLPAPVQKGKRLLLGQWTTIDAAALADTLTIENRGGESDDCGGGFQYEASVVPVEGQPKVGVRSTVDVTFDGPACS